MKKSIKSKLAVFALLLGLAVIGAMCYPVSAGAFDSDSVIVDYVNETVTVLTDTDEIVYFTDVYNKDVAKWDACDVRNGKASFDISWVISNKTVRLYLRGDVNTEVVSVDIIWEEDFSVEFVGTLLTTDITEAWFTFDKSQALSYAGRLLLKGLRVYETMSVDDAIELNIYEMEM